MAISKRQADERFRSEVAIRGFYFTLASRLRGLSFNNLVAECCKRLQIVSKDKSHYPKWPPHFLLQAIEAGAGSCRGDDNKPVTESDIKDILHLFSCFTDPSDLFLLNKHNNAALWLMKQDRIQFDVQEISARENIGTMLRLLTYKSPLHRTEARFESRHGFSIEDYAATCIIAWSATTNKASPTIDGSYWQSIPSNVISQHKLLACIDSLSIGTEELANAWRERRPLDKPLSWTSRQYVLRHRPLLKSTSNLHTLPLPAFALRAMLNNIFSLGDAADSTGFRDELGKSLESVSSHMLLQSPHCIKHIDENSIKRIIPIASKCDGIFEFNDCLLFIECKAIQQNAEVFDARVFLAPQSPTAQIAEGFTQLANTVREVRKGSFDLLGISSNKPCVCLVVTYGHFEQVNHEWFRKTIIESRMQAKDIATLMQDTAFPPQVMSCQTVSRFVTKLLRDSTSPIIEIEAKNRITDSIGDWKQYLANELGIHSGALRNFWLEAFNELWNRRLRFGSSETIEDASTSA